MIATKIQHRGVALPPIRLNEFKKYSSASLLRNDFGRSTCPPIVTRKNDSELDASSPVGYTLKHSDEHTFSHDAARSVLSESFTKVVSLPANEAPQKTDVKKSDLFALVDGETETTENVVLTDAVETALPPTVEEEILDIRIFFPNGKAVQFSVEGGSLVSSSELLDLMAEHLQIDAVVASEAFALWLISPLLEVQLKPHHVAFEVHQKWPVFLRRFALAEEEEIALDEPLLVIRRNFQLTLPNERLYVSEYERLAEILYLDARDQYLAGRYLLDVDRAVELAGLQLAIDFEPYENNEQAMDLIQENLGFLVPTQHLSTIRTFRLFGIAMMECKSGMENEVVDAFRHASMQFASNQERRVAFLAILQETPFYGAAFFTGLRERRSSILSSIFNPFSRGNHSASTISSSNSSTVTVGINHEFITVVNPSRHELITCQPIARCQWRKTEETSKNSKVGDIPLFVLEYPDGSTLSSTSHHHHNNFAARHSHVNNDAGPTNSAASISVGLGNVAANGESEKKNQTYNDQRVDDQAFNGDKKERLPRIVETASFKQPTVNRQIFSKQAAMMEALLNSVCNELYEKLNVVK